jgi:putative ABC transport system permease protein
MTPLDRKLVRDLGAIKGQVAAVALVMACGLAMMILSRSLILSLSQRRDLYYSENQMGTVFADLRRAPKSLLQRIATLPGVTRVEARVKGPLLLDLPGVIVPTDGLALSLPDERDPALLKLFLRQGRLPASGTRGEVAVSESFAEARGLRPGDVLEATLRGKKQRLHITGIALSPEFIFEARPGETLPDPKRFGVFWMRERELAAALDLDGAFNNLVVSTGPSVEPEGVEADLDLLLAQYGGLGSFGLREHPSANRLNDELGILSTLAVAFPLAFLSVAAFMSSSVLTRLVRLQREQIAQLKAFGFTRREIGIHYGKFALVMVVLGAVLGTAGGLHLGSQFVSLYHKFFKFPDLPFQPAWGAVGVAFSASAVASFAGVIGAVLQAVRLAPAQAMRPEPPASFKASLPERLGVEKALPLPVRMALRNIERRPAQALFTTLGLALAAGIPVLPGAMRDGVDHLLSFEWDVAQRQNASLGLREPTSARAAHALAELPGVLKSEAFRVLPVRIRHGHHTRRLLLTGLDPNGTLNRPLDQHGQPVGVPPSGLAISSKLAEVLEAAPGDYLQIEVLEGRRPVHTIRLESLVTDYAGLNAYMGIDAVHALLQEDATVSGAHLHVDTLLWESLFTRIKNTPAISALRLKEATRTSFKQTTAESINLLQTLYFSFAVVVAFGVVYNSARIALSERSRDLATLRVLGFTHGEVAAVLIGELALLTLLAIPAGLAFGSLLSNLIISKVNTESVRLPLVLTSNNFATAATIVLLSALVSFALVTRRIRQLDLLAVLKAAE